MNFIFYELIYHVYDKVYQEDDEEIYEDLCSRKKRESRVSFEILKILIFRQY